MLELHIDQQEFFDGRTEMFFTTRSTTVKLVHSLISISKWEGIWQKPYFPSRLHRGIEGRAEELSYIQCMLIGNYPEYIPGLLQNQYAQEVHDYINTDFTATTIHRIGQQASSVGPTITSEVVYYWMIKFGIPFECDRWHFSRLITLIDVCNVKENNTKGNKLNSLDSALYRQKLNESRRVGL